MLKTIKSLNILNSQIKNSNNEFIKFGISSHNKKLAKKFKKTV